MLYNISKINIRQKDRIFRSPKTLGTVEAVFSSVCLLKTGEDCLLALQNNKAVLSPMSLLVPGVNSFHTLGITQGEPVLHNSAKHRLLIGDNVFDYSEGEYYSSSSPIYCQNLVYTAYLARLEEYLQERKASVYCSLTGNTGTYPHFGVNEIWGWSIRKAAMLIFEGMKADSDTLVRRGFQGMLGLGPGLTPSGDDFLLGLVTALYTSGRYARILEGHKTYIRYFSQACTTRISHDFICYFFEGCYSLPIFKLIEALNNDDLHNFTQLLPIVGEFGHSSGQDYLSGLWWGFKFMQEQADIQKNMELKL